MPDTIGKSGTYANGDESRCDKNMSQSNTSVKGACVAALCNLGKLGSVPGGQR